MYVVTKYGKKLPVDDSNIDYEKDFVPFHDTVGLYTDDTTLRPVWIVTLQRDTSFGNRQHDNGRYEFVAEKRYDHEPSKEEVLWLMSAWGLTRYDIAYVDKVFMLDMEYDD